MIRLTIVFVLFFGLANRTLAQAEVEDENKLSFLFGGSFGVTRYTVQQNDIPVNPYFGSNSFVGAHVTTVFPNQYRIKTSFEFTHFRSPFEDGETYYDEFLQFNILFPFIKTNTKVEGLNFVGSIGPNFLVSLRQGVAQETDKNYTVSSSFGDFMKFGIASEFGFVYSGERSEHAIGLRGTLDIQDAQIDFVTSNRRNFYWAGGLFYSLSLRKVKTD